jgi:hypothetical protein
VIGIHQLEMVARDGIEPSTRGFSVARRAALGARKPKKQLEFAAGRPNRPARPSPYRTTGTEADRAALQAQEAQRRLGIATERGPNYSATSTSGIASRPNRFRTSSTANRSLRHTGSELPMGLGVPLPD